MQTLVFINTPMDSTLEERIRMAAARARISRAEFMRQAARRYLESDQTQVKKEQGGKDANGKL